MMNITLDYAWLEAFLLTMMRMVGFVIIAPPFSYGAFPIRVKGMFAVVLALAVSPRTTPSHDLLATAEFFTHMMLELLTGFTFGFIVFLIFAAVQSAGGLVDMFSSLQMAQAFDPSLQQSSSPFSKLFQLSALLLLFATGGYQLLILGLARTFDAIPLGAGAPIGDSLQAVLDAFREMGIAMVQIAGPVVLVLVLTDVALGLVSRVAPALNAFALGMPLKVLITLALIAVSFTSFPGIIEQLTDTSVSYMPRGR
jgi:flagellar biosynthetic protein FliR